MLRERKGNYYRPDIDGLRALAVTSVILYHADIQELNGGFLGVDVFFVISGYLITRIILDDLEKGDFSLRNFYNRRARRILPALLVVTATCWPFAWAWMHAEEMQDFSQSLISVALFGSNIHFFLESGYFAPLAAELPLLHTWSLSIEEQFYVFFPLIMLLLWPKKIKHCKSIIYIIFITSIFLAEISWRFLPSAGFYLLPMRAWELLAGSIAAITVHQREIRNSNILSLLGFTLVFGSFLLFTELVPTPSLFLLPTIAGTVLIIVYAGRGTYVGNLLSLRPLVFVGLISYSAYLWHQPLFAFARIRFGPDITPANALFLVIATFLLAAITWHFVEKPWRLRREKRNISQGRVFQLSAIGLSFIAVMGFAGQWSNGFAAPRPSYTPRQLADLKPGEAATTNDFFVLGDSHAEHLISGLRPYTSGEVHNMTSPGCIPLRDVDRYDRRFVPGNCASHVNEKLDQLLTTDPDGVLVLSSMGPVYLNGTPFNGLGSARVEGQQVQLISDPGINDPWEVVRIGLRTTFEELSQLENLQVIFVIDVPELGIADGCTLRRKQIKIFDIEITDFVSPIRPSDCYVERSDYDERSDRYKALIYDVSSQFPSIEVFDPTQHFCDDQRCTGYVAGFGYLYRDYDHLSEAGSLFFSKNFFNSQLIEN